MVDDGAEQEEFVCTVERTADPIARTLTSLGEIASTSWCLIAPEVDGRVPGPTDERLVGVLAGADAQVVRDILRERGGEFVVTAPAEIPAEISELLPEGAEWVESQAFNEEATGALYDGRFYFDKKSNRVLFDCSNPVRKDGPRPNVVVG
ncbi:hypothetical protein [Streptomyces niveus]|uniref:hypothetical protein n=1 Tax=Streptomyces niveus TaxID=193462 RepID=UPI003639A7A8